MFAIEVASALLDYACATADEVTADVTMAEEGKRKGKGEEDEDDVIVVSPSKPQQQQQSGQDVWTGPVPLLHLLLHRSSDKVTT